MRSLQEPPSLSSGRFGYSLLLLLLGAVVPLVLFGVISAWTFVEHRRAEVTDQLRGAASGLMVAVDRELTNQLSAMAIVASDPTLDGADLERFNKRSTRALESNPAWNNVRLIDPTTARLVGGSNQVPSLAPSSLSTEHVAEVVRTSRPAVVGAFVKGRLTEGPVIILMAPVIREGQVRYVLGVSMQPNVLNELFVAQGFPTAWTGAILDARMSIAGRSRDASRYIGMAATPTLVQHMKTDEGGMFTALNQEGATVHTVFRRSKTFGWSVALGVPASEIEAPVQSTLLFLSVAGVVLIFLPLAGTLIWGRSVANRRNAYEVALRRSEMAQKEALTRLVKIADNVPGVVYQFLRRADGTSSFPYASDAIRDIFRVTPQEVRENGDKVLACLHPEDATGVARAIRQSASSLLPWQQEFRVQFEDGTVRWLYGNSVPQAASDGGVLWHGFITDITERKEADARALQTEQKFGLILESAADAIFITDQLGQYQYANAAASTLLGYGHDEWMRMTLADVTPSQDLPTILLQFRRLVTTGSLRSEFHMKRKDGSLVPVAFNGAVLPDGNVFGSCRDITERYQAAEQLRESEMHLKTIFDNEPECILILDAGGRLLQMNPAGLIMLEAEGWDDVAATPMRNWVAPESRSEFEEMHRSVMRGESTLCEVEIIGLKGTHRWLEAHGVPMQEHGHTVHLAVARDVTQHREMEAQVHLLAFHDTLTGLPNRQLLADRMAQAMAASARGGHFGAVLFLDLDNFKPINDTHGHEAGDLLLMEVARRLKQSVREIDTVARFGGDEFVVLLSELDSDQNTSQFQALQIAEKIRKGLSEPYAIAMEHGSEAGAIILHRCTACIGVALFLDHSMSQDDIFKHADAAMYLAKEAGRNAVRLFVEDVRG